MQGGASGWGGKRLTDQADNSDGKEDVMYEEGETAGEEGEAREMQWDILEAQENLGGKVVRTPEGLEEVGSGRVYLQTLSLPLPLPPLSSLSCLCHDHLAASPSILPPPCRCPPPSEASSLVPPPVRAAHLAVSPRTPLPPAPTVNISLKEDSVNTRMGRDEAGWSAPH